MIIASDSSQSMMIDDMECALSSSDILSCSMLYCIILCNILFYSIICCYVMIIRCHIISYTFPLSQVSPLRLPGFDNRRHSSNVMQSVPLHYTGHRAYRITSMPGLLQFSVQKNIKKSDNYSQTVSHISFNFFFFHIYFFI